MHKVQMLLKKNHKDFKQMFSLDFGRGNVADIVLSVWLLLLF